MPDPETARGTWPDNDVFGRVYLEHGQAVYYLALRYLCDASRAEDATHDVFLKAYRNWEGFRGDASVRTWLYRITINHCKNLVQSWHDRHIQAADQEMLKDRPASESSSPLRVLESRELGARIRETLEALPPEYRLILLLVADEELSYDEVAQLTGQSVDAVRGKLHRARKAFVAAFSQAQGDHQTARPAGPQGSRSGVSPKSAGSQPA